MENLIWSFKSFNRTAWVDNTAPKAAMSTAANKNFVKYPAHEADDILQKNLRVSQKIEIRNTEDREIFAHCVKASSLEEAIKLMRNHGFKL